MHAFSSTTGAGNPPAPAASRGPSPSARALRAVLSNLPFIIALAAYDVPSLPRTFAVGCLLFLVPGLAWTDHRRGDGFTVLLRALVISLLAGIGCALLLQGLPGPTDRRLFIGLLAEFTNLGLLLGFRRGWFDANPWRGPLWVPLLAVAALFYVQSWVGAGGRVPPLEDQDMETQGTAWGLINELTPTMVTNRGAHLFFAHPLLLHFWIGESALITGDLDRLRYYHESSVAVQDAHRELTDSAWIEKFAELQGDSLLGLRWGQDYARFQADPVLLPTRTPNLFLAALLIIPLGLLVFRISGSVFAAVGAAVLYMTLPEVFVRSSYGGYMACTNFLVLSAAYVYLEQSGLLGGPPGSLAAAARGSRPVFGIGLLAAWANQKALLIPLAALLHASFCWLGEGLGGALRRAREDRILTNATALTAGFAVGFALFAVYGLGLGQREFIADQLVVHIFQRLSLSNVNLIGVDEGAFVYPSILRLWAQFGQHTGWLIVVPAAFATVRAASAPRRATGLFVAWIAIGAVGFSLVDWRQTKHLALLLPALILLTGVWWASLRGRPRAIMTAVFSLALLWNLWRIGQLMADFSYLQPLPIW